MNEHNDGRQTDTQTDIRREIAKGAETIKELSDKIKNLKEKLEAANQSFQELQSCCKDFKDK